MATSTPGCVARRALTRASRFGLLTLAMFVGIALLAAAEGVLLWLVGVNYRPESWPDDAVTHDFLPLAADELRGVSLVSYRRHGAGPFLRDILVHDAGHFGHATSMKLGHLGPQELASAYHADWFAIACVDGSIYVCNHQALGDTPRLIARIVDGPFSSLVCSPDGQLIAAAANGALYVWHVPTGKLRWQMRHGNEDYGSGLCFSGDSRKLLSASGAAGLWLWDVWTGALLKTFSTGGESVRAVALSPDAKTAAYIARSPTSSEIRVLNALTGERLWQADVAELPDRGLEFSADGSLLATVMRVDGRREINVREARTGLKLHTFLGSPVPITGVAFASERMLYAWDRHGVIRCCDLAIGSETWRFSTLDWAARNESRSIAWHRWLLLYTAGHRPALDAFTARRESPHGVRSYSGTARRAVKKREQTTHRTYHCARHGTFSAPQITARSAVPREEGCSRVARQARP